MAEKKKFIVLRDMNQQRRRAAELTRAPVKQLRTRNLQSVLGTEPADLSVTVEQMTDEEADDEARAEETVQIAEAMPATLIKPLDHTTAADAPPADWAINAIGGDQSQLDGSGVIVAVLDTGIDRQHPAFANVHLVTRDFTGEGIDDTHGHGTHVAGTIFGRDVEGTRIGVARGVNRALIGKVLVDNKASSDTIFQAVEWAHQNDAEVICMSLGFDYPGKLKEFMDDLGWPIERATSEALRVYRDNLRLFDNMMRTHSVSIGGRNPAVVVAASGNESQRDGNPSFVIGKCLPSDAVEVISVGAVGPNNGQGFPVAPFSNVDVEVVAPGVGILSAKAGGGLKRMDGTSMAAPHVAGVAALWKQKIRGDGLPPTALFVKAHILASVRADVFPPGLSHRDRGAGLISAPVN